MGRLTTNIISHTITFSVNNKNALILSPILFFSIHYLLNLVYSRFIISKIATLHDVFAQYLAQLSDIVERNID